MKDNHDQTNVLQKKPSWLKKLFASNGFSLGVKSVFTGLGIFLAISSGGILLIAGAALATTILMSTVGKTLVDAQVLINHNKLNNQINAALELTEAKKAYDDLSSEQKQKIKIFLELPENKELAGLNEFLKEKTNTENNPLSTLKAHSRLATFDKVNNIVRSVLGFVKALLLLPLIIFHGIAAVPDIIKSAMSVLKFKVGIKTIKTRDERRDTVSGEEKIKEIKDLVGGNLSSYKHDDMAKTAQQLQILTKLVETKPEISQENFNTIASEKIENLKNDSIQYKPMGKLKALQMSFKGPKSEEFQKIIGNSMDDVKEKTRQQIKSSKGLESSRKSSKSISEQQQH